MWKLFEFCIVDCPLAIHEALTNSYLSFDSPIYDSNDTDCWPISYGTPPSVSPRAHVHVCVYRRHRRGFLASGIRGMGIITQSL